MFQSAINNEGESKSARRTGFVLHGLTDSIKIPYPGLVEERVQEEELTRGDNE